MSRLGNKGFTLVEMAVCLALSALLISSIQGLFAAVARKLAESGKTMEVEDLRRHLRTALNCNQTRLSLPAVCAAQPAALKRRDGSPLVGMQGSWIHYFEVRSLCNGGAPYQFQVEYRRASVDPWIPLFEIPLSCPAS